MYYGAGPSCLDRATTTLDARVYPQLTKLLRLLPSTILRVRHNRSAASFTATSSLARLSNIEALSRPQVSQVIPFYCTFEGLGDAEMAANVADLRTQWPAAAC
jgi:hypothetical protein